MQEDNPKSEQRGIYNITEIALKSIDTIEQSKMEFMLSLSQSQNIQMSSSSLLDLCVSMSNMIKEYFPDALEFKEGGYTIIDYQKGLENIVWKNWNINPILLRRIAQNIFAIWDSQLLKKLKIALPTQKEDFFRKLIGCLYGTVGRFDTDKFKIEYENACRNLNLNPTDNRNRLVYTISRMKDFDLDCNSIVIGAARVGKSTCVLGLAELIYLFRGETFKPKFIEENYIWNSREALDKFSKIKENVLISDEGYFLVDRRLSMNKEQIRYLQLQNALASFRNIIFTIIQNYVDLDQRIVRKANIAILVTKRGYAKVYALSNAFPLIRSSIIDTDKFEDNPRLLSNLSRADYELDKLHTHIFNIDFPKELRRESVRKKYLEIKEEQQKRALSRIMNESDNKERMRDPSYIDNMIDAKLKKVPDLSEKEQTVSEVINKLNRKQKQEEQIKKIAKEMGI